MSELDSVKQLLGLLLQQVDGLTKQTVELMTLKNVSPQYRAGERHIAEELTTGLSTLRQLAKTIPGILDHSEDK